MPLTHIIEKPFRPFVWAAFAFTLLLSACRSSKHLELSKSETTMGLTKSMAYFFQYLGYVPSERDHLPLLEAAVSWLGTPYKYGGLTKEGVDCSGLTYQLSETAYNIKLHRSSQEQFDKDVTLIRSGKLQQGDLLFFTSPNANGKITHVGLFLRGKRFIHAGSKGVEIAIFTDKYWQDNFIAAGRRLH